jgi:hypothetical protein
MLQAGRLLQNSASLKRADMFHQLAHTTLKCFDGFLSFNVEKTCSKDIHSSKEQTAYIFRADV